MTKAVFQEFKKPTADPELFVRLVKHFRPFSGVSSAAVKKFELFLLELKHDEELRIGIRKYILQLFDRRRFKYTFTEIGIMSNKGIFYELRKRINARILPLQPNADTLDFLLTNAFYREWDQKWVNKIPDEKWLELLQLLDISPFARPEKNRFAWEELLFSIQILGHKICASGLQPDFLRMVPENENLDSPFLTLQKEIDDSVQRLQQSKQRPAEKDEHFRQLKIMVRQCNDLLDRAIKNRGVYGISFSTTINILRVRQQINRLNLIFDFILERGAENNLSAVRFFKAIVKIHSGKNRVRKYINETTHLVAYQATQHTGKTGEHYITSTAKEYKKMFLSAAGGGAIVGIMVLIKLLLHHTTVSPFGHAFYYSMNYSLGFILIYLLHFTIATKQPAMTAAALAASLEGRKRKPEDYEAFAAMFARLFRSQFIAFVGNVFLSFPVALLLGLLWGFLMPEALLGVKEADDIFLKIDPFNSPALFHAGIAGFYLFFSGLISGFFINKNIHNKVSYRFRKHPVLRYILPQSWLNGIADSYDKHLGGLTGNFWFGVMLGSTGVIGTFFGLNLDIRHITFSAGNFGLALVGAGFNVTSYQIGISILGIGLIGAMNFTVSFAFSLILAMRSRQLGGKEILNMIVAVWLRFIYLPREFFFPPSDNVRMREAEKPSLEEQQI